MEFKFSREGEIVFVSPRFTPLTNRKLLVLKQGCQVHGPTWVARGCFFSPGHPGKVILIERTPTEGKSANGVVLG